MRIKANLGNPFRSRMRNREKVIEGRLDRDKWTALNIGDEILFDEELLVKVVGKRKYSSFRQMLLTEGLHRVLPGIAGSIEDGVRVYRKFFSEEEERKYGVLAIEVDVI